MQLRQLKHSCEQGIVPHYIEGAFSTLQIQIVSQIISIELK